MYGSSPGSPVHGIFLTRKLERVAISSSRGSSQPRDQTHVSCIGRQIVYCLITWEAPVSSQILPFIIPAKTLIPNEVTFWHSRWNFGETQFNPLQPCGKNDRSGSEPAFRDHRFRFQVVNISERGPEMPAVTNPIWEEQPLLISWRNVGQHGPITSSFEVRFLEFYLKSPHFKIWKQTEVETKPRLTSQYEPKKWVCYLGMAHRRLVYKSLWQMISPIKVWNTGRRVQAPGCFTRRRSWCRSGGWIRGTESQSQKAK